MPSDLWPHVVWMFHALLIAGMAALIVLLVAFTVAVLIWILNRFT